jgi:cobalt/nickel transport system permease protein
LHHVVVERWSRGQSALHRRDARAKLGALLVFLVAVSTTPSSAQTSFGLYAIVLVTAIVAAGLPFRGILGRGALVLPFSAAFAAITWFAGEPERALALAEKSLLSGIAALVMVATTPITQLLRALESLGVPRPLILVVQFLYRYLFVISEQAQHMRLAARSREGLGTARRSRFQAAAGALGVLFARSWERADGIYRAMLARGFRGHFSSIAPVRFGIADLAFLCGAAAVPVIIRLAV